MEIVSLFWALMNLRWDFRRKSEQKGNHASDYKPLEHLEYHCFSSPLRYVSEVWFANQNTPCRGQLGTVSGEEDIPSIVVHNEKKTSADFRIYSGNCSMRCLVLKDPLRRAVRNWVAENTVKSRNTVEQKGGSWWHSENKTCFHTTYKQVRNKRNS